MDLEFITCTLALSPGRFFSDVTGRSKNRPGTNCIWARFQIQLPVRVNKTEREQAVLAERRLQERTDNGTKKKGSPSKLCIPCNVKNWKQSQ